MALFERKKTTKQSGFIGKYVKKGGKTRKSYKASQAVAKRDKKDTK